MMSFQAIGKIPVNVDEMKIDLMSISGHKIYGPKGVGVLYVRRRPRVRIEPIISGGGQERYLITLLLSKQFTHYFLGACVAVHCHTHLWWESVLPVKLLVVR